jgi:predicted aconitase with swiveling domain
VGCIIAEIPCVDLVPIGEIETGMQISIKGGKVVVEACTV